MRWICQKNHANVNRVNSVVQLTQDNRSSKSAFLLFFNRNAVRSWHTRSLISPDLSLSIFYAASARPRVLRIFYFIIFFSCTGNCVIVLRSFTSATFFNLVSWFFFLKQNRWSLHCIVFEKGISDHTGGFRTPNANRLYSVFE